MTTQTPEWRAGPDGLAHAIPVRGALRYACGEIVLDVRWAHPIKRRCDYCLERVGVTVTARAPAARQEFLGWTESELRAAHGDR